MTMLGSVRLAAACAALFAVAAAAPVHAAEVGAYHILPTPSYETRTGRVPHLPPLGEMEYFGGTVFSNVELVSVIWGSGVNSTTVAEIPDFSAAIVDSTFLQQLKEYSTKHVKSINGHK